MGQGFALFNLDNPDTPNNSVDGKFADYFFQPSKTDKTFIRALWRPTGKEKLIEVRGCLTPREGLVFGKSKSFYHDARGLDLGPLLCLPFEVIKMILDEVDEVVDLVAIMTTCQCLWEIGRPCLERFLARISAISWVGDRLICLGDSVQLPGLPPGVLTDEEYEQVNTWDLDDCASDTYYDGPSLLWDALPIIHPRLAYTMRDSFGCRDGLMARLRQPSPGQESPWLKRTDKVHYAVEKLSRFHKPHPRDFFEGRIVFRNLTTKEFVRGDAIADARADEDKPWRKDIGFEHVFWVRTTWSDKPSDLGLKYKGPIQIHRGVWAGHRFDVVSVGNVRDESGGAIDGWKDVTEEVVTEVMDIWDANFLVSSEPEDHDDEPEALEDDGISNDDEAVAHVTVFSSDSFFDDYYENWTL